MFFEKEQLLFNILDVVEIKQTNVNIFNSGRNFNALSFRFHADTFLKTKTDEYYLKDNFVSYIPAGLNYDRISNKDDMIIVHFDVVNYCTSKIECFESKDRVVLPNLFRKILNCWNKKEVGYKYKCSAILCEIFAKCYSQNFIEEPKNSKIQNSIDYILEKYKESDLSVQDIAKQSFMSEVYFRRLFKSEYGISPQKYIINLRIQYATGLISTECYSLKEVAYMSGYNDYNHFSVEFKKIKGVSPSAYSYNYRE